MSSKNLIKIIGLFSTLTILFSLQLRAKTKTQEKQKEISINIKESKITWTGHKGVGSYIRHSHTGNVSIEKGHIELSENQKIKSIFITIDMKSIKNTDISNSKKRKKLENHLKNPDFFDVNKYPSSSFKSTQITHKSDNSYNVKGIMTIKEISHEISFNITVTKNNNLYSGEAKLKIDRTKWNINYKSKKNISGFSETIKSMMDRYKDKLINDVFDLDLKIITEGI